MPSQRQVKNKIRGTLNIRQITRAMEMVAGTKLKKAERVALRARPYAAKALELLHNLLYFAQQHVQQGSKKTTPKRICLVVITSDRGLCGAYNISVLRAAWKFYEENQVAHLVAIGKKAKDFFARRNTAISASFTRFSDIVSPHDAAALSDWLLSNYKPAGPEPVEGQGLFDTVIFCSTVFTSALHQNVSISQILPLEEKHLKIAHESAFKPYLLEPSANVIFEELVEDMVRVEILHVLFEANASEHASRMLAMKSATENADKFLEALTLELNKARQTSITQELAEVSGAKEALTSEL